MIHTWNVDMSHCELRISNTWNMDMSHCELRISITWKLGHARGWLNGVERDKKR